MITSYPGKYRFPFTVYGHVDISVHALGSADVSQSEVLKLVTKGRTVWNRHLPPPLSIRAVEA